MKETIRERIKREMVGQGFMFVASVYGQYSFRKNSNLRLFLDSRGLGQEDVDVRLGAKRRRRNDGYELLVFMKKKETQ